MSKPKLFVGSSQKNLRVAQLVAEGLEECAEVTIWSEGVFGLNLGFLETLLKKLEEYDFAVFVLAPDDLTTSKDETKPSPRDNVLFESGLFMGVLGRERVFLVFDETAGVKIPSDLAGLTLASYDGTRTEGTGAAAGVRKACRVISDCVTALRFPHLVGEWRSAFPETTEEDRRLVEEDVDIRPCRSGISIISKDSPENGCIAFGRMPLERQISGEWKALEQQSDSRGLFLLTISPSGNFMYGYFTSLDETGGITYASWILAKKTGADESKIRERLQRARTLLANTRVDIGVQPGASSASGQRSGSADLASSSSVPLNPHGKD